MPTVRKQTRRTTTPRPAVLVTGGSGGIGRAICLAFAQAGWNVGVHYRTNARMAAQVVSAVRIRGGHGLALQADICDGKQVQEMVARLLDRWGRLDVLVCCAGQASSGLIVRMSFQDWIDKVAVNLTGTFHCLQAAGAVMVSKRHGAIIIVGSLASLQGQTGQAAYAAAKAGLLGLMKTAAKEWGPHSVCVNVVFPGWHKTALAGSAFPSVPEAHTVGCTPDLKKVADSIYHLAQLEDVSGQVWNLDSRIL
ncbi:MAG: SDR family NAD(P)-dependent oxidoreductase [Nitrospira sp.]|nr:SDR family NAD(P)-dependent oxidoreductase [Nitrospira sp.]